MLSPPMKKKTASLMNSPFIAAQQDSGRISAPINFETDERKNIYEGTASPENGPF